MNLKSYIKQLQYFAKQNPSAREMEVVTSSDDEGNSFHPIVFSPSFGKTTGGWDFQGVENIRDADTVCVN